MRTLRSLTAICLLNVVLGLATGSSCEAEDSAGGGQRPAAGPDTASGAWAVDSTDARTARTGDLPAVYHLDEILITASRLPASRELYFSNVAVAVKEDIAEIASSTAAEALATDPGIGLTRYGSYGSLQTMNMRGGSSGEVVYLLDGVPVSDPQISAMDLNWLPRSGMLRVEAMKGASSALYGSGAVTGAVNLVSMDPIARTPVAEVMFWNGGFGSRTVGVTLSRALAGSSGLLGAYDYATSDGWVAHSASASEKLYAKASTIAGGLRISATGFHHTGEIQIPGDLPGRQNDSRKIITASVSRASDGAIGVDYYHSSSRQTYAYEDTCGCLGASENDGGMDGLRVGLTRRSGDRLATSLDAGFEHRRIESGWVGKRTSRDIFASLRGEINVDPWRLAASARLEKNSQFDFESALQATGWFSAGEYSTLFCKVDRSFIYPSFNDLYWRGPNETGDPGLKTEHSNSLEVGALFKRGKLEASATGYYRRVTDMILWRTKAPCSSMKSTNAQVTLKGVEVSARVAPIEGVTGSVSYWLGRAIDDETGEDLEYRPAHVLAWHIGIKRALSKHVMCGATVAGRNVPSILSGDQSVTPGDCDSLCYGAWGCVPDTRLPAYSSALLYVFLGIDRGRVFCRINNVFDDRIVTSWSKQGLALPGRSYEIGLALELLD